MWIAIALVAVAVLGVSVVAGRGRLGEMPQDPVNDRPKGRVPAGPLTPELLLDLRIPTAATGYRHAQVDEYLDAVVAGGTPPSPLFDVVRGGYDMQVVDELIERPRPETVVAEPDDAAFRAPQTSESVESETVTTEAGTTVAEREQDPALPAQPRTDLPDAE